MNLNPSLTLKEQYGPRSEAWQEHPSPPIVRFWCDAGKLWAIPFFQIAFKHTFFSSGATQKLLQLFCGGSSFFRGINFFKKFIFY